MGQIKSHNEKLKQILRGVYQPELEKIFNESNIQKKIIVIAGPTCVGKTDLSIKIAVDSEGKSLMLTRCKYSRDWILELQSQALKSAGLSLII